jgi:hypothetical protein
VSLICEMFGANALRCALCRIRYHDWRASRKFRKPAASDTEPHPQPAQMTEKIAPSLVQSRMGGRAANQGK